MSTTTAHSEYGTIKSLLLKRPRDAYLSDDIIKSQWAELNYLGPPKFEQACIDFEFLEDMISKTGCQIHFLPPSESVTIDSIYCRDASISTEFGIILCRMGKGARGDEPTESRELYEEKGIEILGQIEAPGTLEGGDVAWLDQKTLAVGHGYRTNYDGIEQLKSLLTPKGIEVIVAELPHYRGPSDVFHLMSILSPVDEQKAVVYSPLMPIHFRNRLIDMKFELIEVPDEEFDTMGCNVLAMAPSDCLMCVGNPITKSRMERAGCKVTFYDGAEISAKGLGGPTCLTRPVLRTLP